MKGVVSESIQAPLAGIEAGLQKIFNSLEGNFTRSMSTNRVVLASAAVSQSEIDTLIDTLATTQPGRFFVLTRDESIEELAVSMSARCHQLSRGQSICSEVVHLRYSSKELRAIPSVVKANFLTGRRAELILLGDAHVDALFSEFAALSDILLLDSANFWSDRPFLHSLPELFTRIIDTQWLLLAPWREAVRSIFDSHVHYRELSELQTISVRYSKQAPVPAFLLAAWFAKALQLSVSAFTSGGFECSSHSGLSIQVHLEGGEEEPRFENGLRAVTFSFENSATPDISLDRLEQQVVCSRCDNTEGVLLSQQIDSSNSIEAIERYFSIGESTVRYASSLKLALELSQLKQGFSN